MLSQVIKQDIRIPAVIISLLLSVWCIVIDPVINNDGFLYILLAETVQDGNYFNAFNIYRWPFYSFLIAGLSYFTGLSVELTAYFLNTILIIVIILSYLSIVKLLGGDHRVLLIAGIVILLFPGINRYRSFINRDFGYLAFYMLSLFVFFKHLIKPEWYWPVIWSILLALAALFRIEAVALLIFLPFISWFVLTESKSQRIRIIVLLGIALSGVIVVFAWWFSGQQPTETDTTVLENSYELVKSFIAYLISAYSVRLDQMQILLTQYSQNYAPVILIAALIIILFSEVVRSITLPYIFLVIYGWRKYVVFSEDRIKSAWIMLILIQLIILSGALLKYFFITGRFPLALSLTVLLVIPFILSNVYQEWKEDGNDKTVRRWVFPVTAVLIILVSLQGLNTFTAKNHYKEGGLWIKQQINPEERLLSTDIAVAYYAGRNPYKRDNAGAWSGVHAYEREDVFRILRKNKGKNYRYIAVGIKGKYREQEKQIISLMGVSPIKRLKNNSGDELLIFKKSRIGS